MKRERREKDEKKGRRERKGENDRKKRVVKGDGKGRWGVEKKERRRG